MALPVVLCWHMHQPEYRDAFTREYHLPWTYLHAIKDYIDMAAHIEATPGACAVVNFVPTLLEQIDDYAIQVNDFLQYGKPIQDPLLAALSYRNLPNHKGYRRSLLNACLKANRRYLIEPFPAFKRLADLAQLVDCDDEIICYYNEQYFVDILVWYHLAWLGETVRRKDIRVIELLNQQLNYHWEDRYQLLQVIAELLANIIPHYRYLAEQGKVELSMTPYAHPILPLLLDLNIARQAQPDVLLPNDLNYAGGKQRVEWHIKKGLEVFQHYFGFTPKGCWPSEGGISDESVQLLEQYQFQWVASGQSVLHNSLQASTHTQALSHGWMHTPYQFQQGKMYCFFRDDGLSDLIGFHYSEWNAKDAVNDFIQNLQNIYHSNQGRDDCLVSIILDGENAWEYYPENGYNFLSQLYQALVAHPDIRLTTFSQYMEQAHPLPKLSTIVAGSWVYGTFSTWIGDRDKNRGWEMLIEAKQVFDQKRKQNHWPYYQLQEIERQLAICEGSDWFWWFGDYNPAESVKDFERLFRSHLSRLYQLMGIKAPEYLTHSFTYGGGAIQERGGVMRRGSQ